jgi:hypothetical protein
MIVGHAVIALLGSLGTMAKLYQHQMDETYYTKRNIGGFVTHQIHPDGVAYLKYCGVRVGDEIPSRCMSQLQDYGWLFTKDEVPFWGEVDWSPRWVMIRPRALEDLTPFRTNRSVDDYGLTGAPRSVADSLEAQIEAVRERKALERVQHIAELRAETEARLQRIRKEGEAKIEAARQARAREQAAKRERDRQLEEEQSRKRRAAALKGAETRRRNAERRKAEEAEQRERERQLAEKRRETARKAAVTRQRNAGARTAGPPAAPADATSKGPIPGPADVAVTLRDMGRMVTTVKDHGAGSRPASRPGSDTGLAPQSSSKPIEVARTRVWPAEVPDNPHMVHIDAPEPDSSPLAAVFAAPMTSETVEKVAASSPAISPEWMSDRRKDKFRAAEIDLKTVQPDGETPFAAWWHLLWTGFLLLLVVAWVYEPLLGVLLVTVAVVWLSLRVVGNLLSGLRSVDPSQ